MGDKSVKKKIIMLTVGLLILNPTNTLAKSSNTEINKPTYNKTSLVCDKEPINSPSNGTDLYIISFDEILQLRDGTRKRADALLGYNCRYYYAYAVENKKTEFLELKYKGKVYYIALGKDVKVSEFSDITTLQQNYTIYSDSKENNSDFHEPHYSMDKKLTDAIEQFNELNSNIDTEDEFKIWENLAKVIYGMKLEYGGNSSDQGNLIDNKTKCDGFTWIVSQLLSNTNIPYRFVHVTDGYRSNRNVSHVLLEIKAPDGNWKLFECTGLAYEPNRSCEHYINYVNGILNSKNSALPREKVVYIGKNENTYLRKEYFISKVYKHGKIDENTKYENIREAGCRGCIYE